MGANDDLVDLDSPSKCVVQLFQNIHAEYPASNVGLVRDNDQLVARRAKLGACSLYAG